MFFKSKKPKFEIKEAEKVTMTHKASGKEYTYYIGMGEDAKWYAFAQNPFYLNLPSFCLECNDKDHAYEVGMMAYRLHLEG